LRRDYGVITPLDEPGSSAPARRFALEDGTTFGIVASTTEPFCHACGRSRLTADGIWYLCLYATHGVDLRAPLRRGSGVDALKGDPHVGVARPRRPRRRRPPRARRSSRVHFGSGPAGRDPHLEMHTRGG
jgi:cyclic pyranopterin phosphate synthase